MQVQTTLLKPEETVEHELLLQGTVRALKEATVEVGAVSSIVSAQGELIERIQQKITDAEGTLKHASRTLSHLVRQSRKRRLAAFCLLAITTVWVLSLIGVTLFKR